MSVQFEQFTPTIDHPWAAPTVRLVCQEVLGIPPKACKDTQYCINEYLGCSDSDYYGLSRQSELLAVGSMGLIHSQLMELEYLAVHPDMYGRGYGTRMLAELEAIAVAAGASTMKTTPVFEAEGFFLRYGTKTRQVTGSSAFRGS